MNNLDNPEDEDSEILDSRKSVTIKFEKISKIGRRYKWQRINHKERISKFVFGLNYCVVLLETGEIIKWEEPTSVKN